jgi:hypothetical protein
MMRNSLTDDLSLVVWRGDSLAEEAANRIEKVDPNRVTVTLLEPGQRANLMQIAVVSVSLGFGRGGHYLVCSSTTMRAHPKLRWEAKGAGAIVGVKRVETQKCWKVKPGHHRVHSSFDTAARLFVEMFTSWPDGMRDVPWAPGVVENPPVSWRVWLLSHNSGMYPQIVVTVAPGL